MGKGKLIVFEGTDGSGKSTQFDLLLKYLAEHKIEFARLRFPRYDNPSSMLVRMYLSGGFGTHPDDINPYAASTFYAVDRYASYIQDWREYYNQGGLVLADRYTTSNAVHQGGKIPKDMQNDFLDWLYDFEFNKIGIPKPDAVILVDMLVPLAQKLLQSRVDSGGDAKDIHEVDVEYLQRCRNAALDAAKRYKWSIVKSYTDDSTIRPIEDIHNDIIDIIKEII